VTGHTGDASDEPDWAALARSGLSLVIYMGVQRLQTITDALTQAGLAAHTPAAIVCSAHTPSQRQAVCTLATLVHTVTSQGLASPAIVVVGDVVKASPMWGQWLQDLPRSESTVAGTTQAARCG
jgi:uroporphyrin-III C-methyltransferase